jgi:hypothetical protein
VNSFNAVESSAEKIKKSGTVKRGAHQNSLFADPLLNADALDHV